MKKRPSPDKKLTYQKILHSSVIKKIRDKSRRRKLKIYLVGGFLRDFILERERGNFDVDFAVSKNAISFARPLAKELNLPFVLLDKEHGSCRIVYKNGDRPITLDFTDFRGKNLEQDLLHRDFTINTLAIDLENLFKKDFKRYFIDLYGAIKDLSKKIIRLAYKKAFDEDSVRILRAFSMYAMLGFKIDKSTENLLRAKAGKIKSAAPERIQEELFKILQSGRSYETFVKMDSLKFLTKLFPEFEKLRGVDQGPYHHLDVWRHSLVALDEMERFLEAIKKSPIKNKARLIAYLNENIASGHKRYAVLKLAALTHDLGKPRTRIVDKEGRRIFHGHERAGLKILDKILSRLKLSNQEEQRLRRMMLHHLRPGFLSNHEFPTSRAVFRYFRDAQDDAVGILLLSLADARATRGPFKTKEDLAHHEKIIFKLIDEFFDEKVRVKPKKIVDGFDLMKALKIKPSKLVGELLFKVQEAQAEGKVRNKKDAIAFSKRCVK